MQRDVSKNPASVVSTYRELRFPCRSGSSDRLHGGAGVGLSSGLVVVHAEEGADGAGDSVGAPDGYGDGPVLVGTYFVGLRG